MLDNARHSPVPPSFDDSSFDSFHHDAGSTSPSSSSASPPLFSPSFSPFPMYEGTTLVSDSFTISPSVLPTPTSLNYSLCLSTPSQVSSSSAALHSASLSPVPFPSFESTLDMSPSPFSPSFKSHEAGYESSDGAKFTSPSQPSHFSSSQFHHEVPF
eukprot:GILI01033054.1.p1 GENE.GILI01033054.1~~GILI01033054.1.p1  ORF type:complete len:168 (+),score=25.10 GILI01033054.1:35-505(+)